MKPPTREPSRTREGVSRWTNMKAHAAPSGSAKALLCSSPNAAERRVLRELRRHLGEVFRGRTKGRPDRRRPSHAGSRSHGDLDSPKYAVSQIVGFIKDKSAIHLARGERKRS